ncbi:MAG: prepilin-type N-terminal cleavage/methylation domain-containing protein [bacterium]|nr:prepilin-type N-terminal cleavage/methylation domain-containing protein [bacterium]
MKFHFKDNKKGFTLIEVTIALVIISMMVVVLGDMYMNGTISSGKEMRKSKLQVESKSVLEGINENVKLSAKVGEAYAGYTGGATTLILDIPAIDNSDIFLYSGSQKVYDHIIYYIEGSNLHKLVLSDNVSSRLHGQNNLDQVILDNVSSLVFSYDQAPPSSTMVNTSLTIQNTGQGQTQTINVTAEAKRRNSE